MAVIYDNQVVLHISLNLIFHKMTKHREQIVSRDIKIEFINLNDQLADILTQQTGLIIFVTSLIHMIYRHQLEDECWM